MLTSSVRNFSLYALMTVSLFAGVALAQTTASLSGAVKDPSQAAIPNVVVKATNEGTGVVSSTKTNSDGLFAFENLPIGRYDLAVGQPGFKAYSVTGIVLDLTEI